MWGTSVTTLAGLMVGRGRKIQITVDDAPGLSTAAMLATLRKFRIQTMFFVEGEFVRKRPDDLTSILRDGHQLGLHTWDHPKLTRMTEEKIREEFQSTDDLVKQLTGKSMAPNWRPPYGAADDRVKRIASSLGFTKMWLWDVDSLDWKHMRNTKATVAEVEKGLTRTRKVTCDVLFHDKQTSVEALEILLPRLQIQGYTFANFP